MRPHIVSIGLIVLLFSPPQSGATPPDYSTFKRDQLIDYVADEDELVRIWMIYVDQGDSLLIQIPRQLSTRDRGNTVDEDDHFIDVLVDAGAEPRSSKDKAVEFIQALYPYGATIEYVIITHHDSDHVLGITPLLQDQNYRIETIYHNGLASYVPGVRDFPASGTPTRPAIYVKREGRVSRWLGYVADDGTIDPQSLIQNLGELRSALAQSHLHNVYEDLGAAVVNAAKSGALAAFDRAFAGGPFIDLESEALTFELLWPHETLRKYGDWGKTINGNSLTFRFSYKDFAMLFTGDHNKPSQLALLDQYPNREVLNADVLKLPHHGSGDSDSVFLAAVNPVLSLASMGAKGFKSKRLNDNRLNWQHPATEIIQSLGGAHRVYHTHIHERRFRWDDLETFEDHERLVEGTHILIETDGERFRLVETERPEQIPKVSQTRRSNGTRWILAR